ncbi:ArsR/SmtB family transcription factor [Anaerobacterium chartisolvens]
MVEHVEINAAYQIGELLMSNMGNQLVSNIFKALSHPTRLQIIRLLKEKPLCVCEILPQLESEQSNTSQHLSVLKNQGIVDSKKDGLMVIYRIKSPEVYQMIGIAEGIILRQIEETKSLLEKNK